MTSSPSSARLVPPLALASDAACPGDPREVDPADTPRLVEYLNELGRGEGLGAALRVAQFLLDVFFEGDAAIYRDQRSDPRFRALLDHEHLDMSTSFIWYAIAVWEQCTRLPPDVASGLPLAHHRALLPVRDPDQKLRLAREALERDLSKRELVRLVKRTTGASRRRGRPRTPSFVKAARLVRKGLDALADEPFDPRVTHRYGVHEAERALEDLRDDLEAWSRLVDRLEARLRVVKDTPG